MVEGLNNCGTLLKKEYYEEQRKKKTQKEQEEFDNRWDEFVIGKQNFDKADLVILGTKDCKEYNKVNQGDNGLANTDFYRPMWAVYGSSVVESKIHRDNIKELQCKTVWASKKPYVLSGDLT